MVLLFVRITVVAFVLSFLSGQRNCQELMAKLQTLDFPNLTKLTANYCR